MNTSISGVYKLISLALICMLLACSTQKNEPDTQNQPIEQSSNQSTTTHTAQIELNVGFSSDVQSPSNDGDLKALDGVEFLSHWLVPNISEQKVNGVVIISDGTSTTFTEKEFNYDENSRTISYKGAITLPNENTTGSSLKMRILVYPDGWWNSQTNTLTIPQQNIVKEENRTDKTALDLKIAYISNWETLISAYNGAFWYPTEDVHLRPIGHVMRITVQDTQTEMGNVTLKGIGIETTLLSRSGSFNFSNASPTNDTSWIASSTETTHNNNTAGIYYYKFPITETNFRTPQTYYIWVHPRANINTPHTRGFLELTYNNPPIDPRLTGEGEPWWYKDKTIVASYSGRSFTNAGSQTYLRLTNENALTHISRFTASFMGKKRTSATWGESHDTAIGFMTKFSERESGVNSTYLYSTLESLGLVTNGQGNTVTTLQGKMPMYTNNTKLTWRLPSLAEIKLYIPSLSAELSGTTNIFAFPTMTVGKTATVNEFIKAGNRTTASHHYTGDYKYYQSGGFRRVDGIRLMGNGDKYKSFYMYRYISSGELMTQIWVSYLGPFYPDITNIEQYLAYKGVLPTIEERIYNWYPNAWNKDHGITRGQRFWISDRSSNGYPQYVEVDHYGSIQVKEITATSGNSAYASVILMRDFGDFTN